ncbi:ribosome biogenesis protein tsr1 [Maublancomyces gigas]|uniref:Ribosome biogenesis protein tsr1 n=1 Tax=Discina gigas TaxID=1032678 RepID=A0ABR3GY28_9PEZI
MVSAVHHHRPTAKASNKSFKSRHATKSSLKARSKGRIEDLDNVRKSPHQTMMSKLGRRNKARQVQANKHKELIKETRIFDGRKGAPRIVAVVPLCEDGDAAAAVRELQSSLDLGSEVPGVGSVTTEVERFKQKIQWIVLGRELLAVLDACRIADFVVLVLSANQEVDSAGELIIRSVEAQGISNTVVVVQHMETLEQPKRKPEIKKSLLSYISHFYPTTAKVNDLSSAQESSNVIRSLCTQTPKGVHWRDARSYLLADDVRWSEEEGLAIGGVIRGKGLNVDRLVHIQGYGDFQIEKICEYPSDSVPKVHGHGDVMAVDPSPTTLASPTENQDSLLDLAPEAEMQDISDLVSEAPTNMTESRRGVLLDDHHYFDDDIDTINIPYERPMRLPKGTSSYQAAWILDEDSDASDLEGSDCDDLDMDMEAARPEDGVEGLAGPAMTEMMTDFGDDAKSELFLDRPPDQEIAEIAAFRNNRAADATDDREFPDELELHPNVTARERLARYRGLKSLRTSKWETTEDTPFQPENWDRLARIGNYKSLKNKVLSEALVGGVVPGSRVLVHLRAAPRELVAAHSAGKIVALYGLLQHEHKQAVVNFSLTPSTEYVGPPIKAKDTLVVQVGPRRMIINPLFSQAGGTGRNNVAKFERFLAPGRTSVATVVGPVMWGSVPAVFWRQTESGLELVGSGSFVNVDQARVVAKRVVLTGHPFKIHKKLVTVRYMFFNAEDVAWFKAIPLFTKRGRSGFVKESLGTHGYFKATFDGKINPQDAVAISLYKRVFPRGSEEFRG